MPISCKQCQVYPVKSFSLLVKTFNRVLSHTHTHTHTVLLLNQDVDTLTAQRKHSKLKQECFNPENTENVDSISPCSCCTCCIDVSLDSAVFIWIDYPGSDMYSSCRSEEALSTVWSSGTVSSRPWTAARVRNALAPASMGRRPRKHQTWGR